jgi:cobalt-zinc-cadmium resistance protein CzcA
MVENAIRRVGERQYRLGRTLTSAELRESVVASSAEVRRATMFGEIIIAIVYLPILSLRGIEGKLFTPMAATVVCALAAAMVLSFTYVPAALTIVLRGRVTETESPLIRFAHRLYEPLFRIVRRYRHQSLAASVCLVVAAAAIFPMLGAEFIPRLDEGSLAVQIARPPSSSLDESIRSATATEKTLLEFPEVTRVVSKTGRAQVATDPMGVELSDVFVALKPPAEWTSARTREELIGKMAEALERRVPSAQFSFSQPIELRVSELISGVKSDIAVKVFGDDLETLKKNADKISGILSQVPGAQDVKVEAVSGLPQLQIRIDRAAIARYGLNVEDVNAVVASLVAGQPAGCVQEGEQRFPVVVRLAESSSRDIEAIRNLTVTAPGGARVPLSRLADVSVVEGPAQVSREDARRRVVVEVNVRGRDLAGFVRDAQAAVTHELQLPVGYYLTWGGQFENLQRASERLLLVVPVALLLIFLLLFMSFGSARQAALIFTGIPFAAVGGVLALAARGLPFSISAGVGFIALFGVAVLNGLVMVSAINQLLAEGGSLADAVREGAQSRVRPVLMTALVASLGFLPMALSTTAGAEVQRPLATVVIGGLVTSTLLTLWLLPTLYEWVVAPKSVSKSV